MCVVTTSICLVITCAWHMPRHHLCMAYASSSPRHTPRCHHGTYFVITIAYAVSSQLCASSSPLRTPRCHHGIHCDVIMFVPTCLEVVITASSLTLPCPYMLKSCHYCVLCAPKFVIVVFSMSSFVGRWSLVVITLLCWQVVIFHRSVECV